MNWYCQRFLESRHNCDVMVCSCRAWYVYVRRSFHDGASCARAGSLDFAWAVVRASWIYCLEMVLCSLDKGVFHRPACALEARIHTLQNVMHAVLHWSSALVCQYELHLSIIGYTCQNPVSNGCAGNFIQGIAIAGSVVVALSPGSGSGSSGFGGVVPM